MCQLRQPQFKNRPFDMAKAGSLNEQNVGDWCLVRNGLGLRRINPSDDRDNVQLFI